MDGAADIRIAALLVAFSIAGCSGIPVKLDVPRPTTVAISEKVEIRPGFEKFALTKLINGIDRGEKILAFPISRHSNFNICNYPHRASGGLLVTYGGGQRFLGNWSSELGR